MRPPTRSATPRATSATSSLAPSASSTGCTRNETKPFTTETQRHRDIRDCLAVHRLSFSRCATTAIPFVCFSSVPLCLCGSTSVFKMKQSLEDKLARADERLEELDALLSEP